MKLLTSHPLGDFYLAVMDNDLRTAVRLSDDVLAIAENDNGQQAVDRVRGKLRQLGISQTAKEMFERGVEQLGYS